MRTKRTESPARDFTEKEKVDLIEYLLEDCSGAPNLSPPIPMTFFEEAYPRCVERFVGSLNKKGEEYRLPRITMRKLWNSDALRRCQMLSAGRYVFYCLDRKYTEQKVTAWVELRKDTAIVTRDAKSRLRDLQLQLTKQNEVAATQFGFPGLKEMDRKVLDLAFACIEAIEGMEDLQSRYMSVRSYFKKLSTLTRTARQQVLGVDHPSHGRASSSDLSTILPVLHESIAGRYPSRKEYIDYDPGNLTKDVSRAREEESIGRVKSLIAGFEKIIPGFSERILIEPISEMPKVPLSVPVSADCSEVFDLNDLHIFFRGLQDREMAARMLPTCIEAAQEFLAIRIRNSRASAFASELMSDRFTMPDPAVADLENEHQSSRKKKLGLDEFRRRFLCGDITLSTTDTCASLCC